MSHNPHDEMLSYFGFRLWAFYVKHKEMPGINLTRIFWCDEFMEVFSSLICACQPFSVIHNTEPPHHSISFQRSCFSLLLFGNSTLEFITLDTATPFLSSCAIRASKWCDLPATQYNLRTEAINNTDPSKGLWHVQSFHKENIERKGK